MKASTKVLILNSAWQAIDTNGAQEVLGQMFVGAVTPLEINGDQMRPLPWNEWVELPFDPSYDFVQTKDKRIRIPSVVVATKFSKIPKRKRKFSLVSIAERDGWICQYSGEELTLASSSRDHVVPLSRGGKDVPENVVLAKKSINHAKGNKLNSEIGLKLIHPPRPLRDMLPAQIIHPTHKDHEKFLLSKRKKSGN